MADIGNVWKILGTKGAQMSPQALMQMAGQAAPDDSVPPFLRAQNAEMPMQAPEPPPPQIIPVSNDGPRYSVQPTTSPTGSLPQEIVPQQTSLMSSQSTPMGQAMDRYNEAYNNFKLPNNSRMLKEFQTGEQNYSEHQAAHQQEIDKLKDGLAKYASSDRGINFTPLAALSDAWYGGNLTAAAQSIAPESAAQKAQHMAEMQAKIAGLQGEIPKEELDLLKTKLAQMGYMDERALKSEVAKLNASAKVAGTAATQAMTGKRVEMMEQRLDLQTGKEARGTVNNDAMLKQYGPRLEGAAKIGELIQAAKSGKVVSNQALLGQLNAEIARLETGSQSPGLGQGEKTELLDASARLGALKDQVTGKPTDAVHPEVLDTAQKMVSELSGSYMKGVDSRMDMLRSGMTPAQQQIVDEKHASLKATYAPRFGGWHGLNESQEYMHPGITDKVRRLQELKAKAGGQ